MFSNRGVRRARRRFLCGVRVKRSIVFSKRPGAEDAIQLSDGAERRVFPIDDVAKGKAKAVISLDQPFQAPPESPQEFRIQQISLFTPKEGPWPTTKPIKKRGVTVVDVESSYAQVGPSRREAGHSPTQSAILSGGSPGSLGDDFTPRPRGFLLQVALVGQGEDLGIIL